MDELHFVTIVSSGRARMTTLARQDCSYFYFQFVLLYFESLF